MDSVLNKNVTVKTEVVLNVKFNAFGITQVELDKLMREIECAVGEKKVIRVRDKLYEKKISRKGVGYDSNIMFNVIAKSASDFKNYREKINNLIKKYTKKDVNNIKPSYVKKILCTLDYSKFMEEQPPHVLLTGLVMFGSAGTYKKNENKELEVSYTNSRIVFIPNPRYVSTDLNELDVIYNFFNYIKFKSTILLPYPKGGIENYKEEFIMNGKGKCDIMVFQVLKPQVTDNKRMCLTRFTTMNINIGHVDKDNKPVRELVMKYGFRNQMITIDNLYYTICNGIRNDMFIRYLKRESKSDIDWKKNILYLEKYFYLREYDDKLFDNIPNIMLSDENSKYNENVKVKTIRKPRHLLDKETLKKKEKAKKKAKNKQKNDKKEVKTDKKPNNISKSNKTYTNKPEESTYHPFANIDNKLAKS